METDRTVIKCHPFWILLFSVFIVNPIGAQKTSVVLLDSTKESSLDWTRYPYGPQSKTPGWVEESFTNFEKGINWRSYVVCDVAYKNVNNWLWTPFIERHDANRIYIEIKFSMRDCNLFPGMALSCKETFSLLYHEFDSANKEQDPPPWEPESYKLIDRIAADEGRFTSNSETIINTEVRSIPVSKKGVYFAFRDQGACLSLMAIKIFYVACPNITTNFAHFSSTPTGKELTAIVPAEGTCVPNAVEVEKPRLLCKGDGNWTLPSGGCECMPGYEPLGQSCQVCPPGTFKPSIGSELCGPCPAHSTALYRGSTECRCDHGYHRAAKDPKWFHCTQPPSAPQNLTVKDVDQSSVVLFWSPPKYLGGRNDTIYRVECDQCPSTTVYSPSSEGINETRVTISGLNPSSSYRFTVYSENGVSGSELSQFVETTVNTESSGYISLVITEDDNGHKFNVNVDNGTTTKTESTESSLHPIVEIMIGIIITCLLIMFGITICIKIRSDNSSISKVPSLEHPPIVPTATFNSPFSVTSPLFTHCGTSRAYVDPHTYEDPHQAIREFTREIDTSHITIEAIIGGGEFGDVCRGKLKIPGRPEVTVAIKTLKPGAADKARMDFLTEASIMGQFDHPNVIYLQGVVTKSNPIMIITEYMDNGSLDAFLRANEAKFQIIQLVAMLRGIAAGMQYLSEINYVHRDLAARNVLVNAALVCKIADFGLSREIESANEGAYTTRGGKIPVRWTAPEAIAFRKFTSSSDVWSFGIVCWEVLSYGERPYWNWSNQDVIKGIEKGYRLPPPMDCPEAIHQLMLDCWQKDWALRPTFPQIVKTLDKLIRCPESLQKIIPTSYPPLDPFSDPPVIPDVIQFKTIDEWLSSIKLTRYRPNFEAAGLTNITSVFQLMPQDLSLLGITVASHQKKILASLQNLRAQTSIGIPEGFLV